MTKVRDGTNVNAMFLLGAQHLHYKALPWWRRLWCWLTRTKPPIPWQPVGQYKDSLWL